MFEDSQFITIHGLSVHYRVVEPEGELRHRVLLIAAPGQSTWNWRHIVPELTKAGCRCVLCDLPGYGLSECKDDVPQDHMTRAQFLWGLLDTLDLENGEQLNCWHLMAHGSACGTVCTMASLHPDSVSSMVLAAPMLYPPLPAFIMNMAKYPFVAKALKAWMKYCVNSTSYFKKVISHIYGKPLKQRSMSMLKSAMLGLMGHEEMLCRLLTDGFTTDTSQLNALYIPTMVLWASRDALLGDRIPARLRSDIAHAEYHTLPTGHFLHETNSRAMCDFLRGWMKCFTAGSNF